MRTLAPTADWIICLDIDEFMDIHAGNHTLPALLAARPEATSVSLTWHLFGNAGVVADPEAGVLPTFPRAAPRLLPHRAFCRGRGGR